MSAEYSSVCAIAVMAKASIAGKTKTRLIPAIGAVHAAELNTAFLRDVTNNLFSAAKLISIDPWMAYAPNGSADFFKSILPPEVGLIETVHPTFDACLLHPLTVLFAKGYGAVCLLNSDSPTLPPAYLVAAATLLSADGDRGVIGPSIDGGYYLIGLKVAHPRLFENIDWSTERVFEQTMQRAREIALPMAVLPTWYDVDDMESLAMLEGEVLRGRRFRNVGALNSVELATTPLIARLTRDENTPNSDPELRAQS